MKQKDPINRAELAARAGVSRTAATKAFKNQFSDLEIDGKIDGANPRVLDYVNKDRRDLPVRTTEVPHPEPAPDRGPITETARAALSEAQVEELETLTLREIGIRYGTIDGFKKYIDVLKLMADFQYRDIKVRADRGLLIERDIVKGKIIPLIDTAFTRLVTDVPSTLSALVVARVEAGGDGVREDVEAIYREANSKALKNVKIQIMKNKVMK